MSICPVMSHRTQNFMIFCTPECEWYNRHLKGCHISSFVMNINKFMLMMAQAQDKPEKKVMLTRKEYVEKYTGMSEEEKQKEIFSHAKE